MDNRYNPNAYFHVTNKANKFAQATNLPAQINCDWREDLFALYPEVFNEITRIYCNEDDKKLCHFVEKIQQANLFNEVQLLFDTNRKYLQTYCKLLTFILANKQNKEFLNFLLVVVITLAYHNRGKLNCNKVDLLGNTLADWENVIRTISNDHSDRIANELLKPLIISVYCRNKNLVTSLINYKISINAILPKFNIGIERYECISPLDIAFLTENNFEIALLLLQNKAQIRSGILLNEKSGHRVYALLKQLIEFDKKEIIASHRREFFFDVLENMKEYNQQLLLQKFGAPFLSIAIANVDLELVMQLHQKDVNINAEFPYHYKVEKPIIAATITACQTLNKQNTDMGSAIKVNISLDILDYLLKLDVDVNVYSQSGLTPFGIAIEHAQPIILKKLLDKNNNISKENLDWLIDRAKKLYEDPSEKKSRELRNRRLKVLHLISSLSSKSYGFFQQNTPVKSAKEMEEADYLVGDEKSRSTLSKYKKILQQELKDLVTKSHLFDKLKNR